MRQRFLRSDGRVPASLPHDTDEAARLARRHDDRIDQVSLTPDATHRLRHVFEIRHQSYLDRELVRIARKHGVALAFSHSSEWPFVEEITAGFVYVRLHGPTALYESPYTDAALRNWADRVETWRRAGQPDGADTITDRRPPARKERDIYVYFDNDTGAIAPRQAERLAALLGGR